MAYTVTEGDCKDVEWDDNPNAGATTTAEIEDGAVTSLHIGGNTSDINVIYTLDIPTLEHVKNTITDLLTILTPLP